MIRDISFISWSGWNAYAEIGWCRLNIKALSIGLSEVDVLSLEAEQWCLKSFLQEEVGKMWEVIFFAKLSPNFSFSWAELSLFLRSPTNPPYYMILPDTAGYSWILPDTGRYCQILPDTSWYFPILPDTAGYCPIIGFSWFFLGFFENRRRGLARLLKLYKVVILTEKGDKKPHIHS